MSTPRGVDSDESLHGARDVRVLLVERRGCHLCAAAHDVLDRVAERTGHSWASVDVHGNEELLVAFGELVPLVLVDGAVAGYWRLDPARIEAALEAGS